jgi:putative sigma-54 modulation protein
MKFEYSGRHIEVTPALRAHVENQFEKIMHVFGTKPMKVHVIIEVERGRHRSEIIANWRNDTLTANTANSDMYKSLSLSISKIEKQALKLKNKVIDRSHKAKKTGEVAPKLDDAKLEPVTNRIIAERRYAVKPISPKEAAFALKGNRKSFLVFRNAETGQVSVIFKRDDGNFGLIEP